MKRALDGIIKFLDDLGPVMVGMVIGFAVLGLTTVAIWSALDNQLAEAKPKQQTNVRNIIIQYLNNHSFDCQKIEDDLFICNIGGRRE